jgi:alanyl aminopeptidase
VPVIQAHLDCPRLTLTKAKGTPPVPVCWKTATEAGCTLVGDTAATATLSAGCPSWVYLNANGAGYYRTAWTGAQLDALQLDALTGAERLTLVHDVRALRPAGKDLLKRLAADVQPEIARAARDALGQH